MKDIMLRVWSAIKSIKWRWVFVYPIYTFLIYTRVLKLFGSRLLGAAALCLALLVVNHYIRKIE